MEKRIEVIVRDNTATMEPINDLNVSMLMLALPLKNCTVVYANGKIEEGAELFYRSGQRECLGVSRKCEGTNYSISYLNPDYYMEKYWLVKYEKELEVEE